MRFRRIAVSLSCLCLAQLLKAQLTHTVTFDRNLLGIDTTVVDSVSYLKINYPDLWGEGNIGSPELPVHYLRFSVPYDATGFTVTVTGENAVTEQYALPVYPVQPPVPTDESAIGQPFVRPDSSIYGSDQYWPAAPAQVAGEGFLDGDNHIVTVAVWPVSYAPASGEIRFRHSVTIRLDYTVGNENMASVSTRTSALRAVTRRSPQGVNRWGREQTKLMVVNPSQVDGFAPATVSRAVSPRTVTALPDYEYTVITSRELAPAFDRLIGWKRQKGYRAGVVCIEDILACPDFQDGDLVSNIDDDAGKLRAYLKYAYGIGDLRYVLLAGDYTVLPIRYATGRHPVEIDSVTSVTVDWPIPSDLYFSDFNGNWNADGDSLYGELEGGERTTIDYNPEIFVGRLLCTTQQEIGNYTEKLLRYERNPGNGNYSYLQKAFYCQSDQMQQHDEASIIKEAWGTTFLQNTVIEEEPTFDTQDLTFPTGAEVIAEMNNRYGFFSWHGHGSPAGITVRSRGVNSWDSYAIVPFDGILDLNDYSMNIEVGHGLDCLTNQNYPAIAYSIACDVTPFDIFRVAMGTPYEQPPYDIKYNIGSSFTVGGLYGGPAFLGNTRSGWVSYSYLLEKSFVEQIKSGNYQIGIAEALSKSNFGSGDTRNWCKLTHHLIGCPEFEMWTGIPTEYSGITVSRTDNSITVASSGLDGSKVVITTGVSSEVKTATGTSVTFTSVSPNSAVMVYKHNAIPYVAPLYLQNDTIRSSQYLYASTAFIGRGVDTSRTIGDLVLKSGTLTIEAGGDVRIGDGLVIQNGATLVIKSQGNVFFIGGTVQSGGSLRVDASGRVELQRNFDVRSGSKVEIR